jgi:predicted HicB family RNase H-like nuclease
MDETHGMMLRIPKGLHTQLVREAAEQTIKAGKQISVNGLVVSILETYFAKRGGKRG